MKLREIIVVDDSDPDLLYTRIVLETAAVAQRVLPFETAIDALAFLQREDGHDVDVILLDINMPEMSGFEFLDRYQALHANHQARAVVVMLTSSPNPADRVRAQSYACVKGYVVKPVGAEEAQALVDLVNQIQS